MIDRIGRISIDPSHVGRGYGRVDKRGRITIDSNRIPPPAMGIPTGGRPVRGVLLLVGISERMAPNLVDRG